MSELVAFRAVQGIGAGGLMVGAQAIIADIVPPRDRGRYMGLIGSVFTVASVAGPLLGGFLVESLSWRWVFYVNLPMAWCGGCRRLPAAPAHPAAAPRDRLSWAPRCDRGRQLAAPRHQVDGNEYAWGSAVVVGLLSPRWRCRRPSSGGSAGPSSPPFR